MFSNVANRQKKNAATMGIKNVVIAGGLLAITAALLVLPRIIKPEENKEIKFDNNTSTVESAILKDVKVGFLLPVVK